MSSDEHRDDFASALTDGEYEDLVRQIDFVDFSDREYGDLVHEPSVATDTHNWSNLSEEIASLLYDHESPESLAPVTGNAVQQPTFNQFAHSNDFLPVPEQNCMATSSESNDIAFLESFAGNLPLTDYCIFDNPSVDTLESVARATTGNSVDAQIPPIYRNEEFLPQVRGICSPNIAPTFSESSQVVFPANFSNPLPMSNTERPEKKRKHWSVEEHRLFLIGMEKFKKGSWKEISEHYVTTRTPIQIASHAQKYFQRQSKKKSDTTTKTTRKRRRSINDMTIDPLFFIH